MDVIKSIRNLSDSEKSQLIVELLLRDTDNQNDPDNTFNSIQRFLADKSPEKNSPSPKQKQKTLDEWLIKRNDTSQKLVNQSSSHQATKSDFNKASESEKNSEKLNTRNSILQNSENRNDDSIMPSTSRLVEKSSMSNYLSPCDAKEADSSNLYSKNCASRSKRKVLQPSPGLERERTSNRVRSTCEKQDHLHINDTEEIESDKLADHNCTSESINQKNIIVNNNLITKKNKYNLRTKTKNSKLVQVDKANNSLTTENNRTDIVIKNISHRSNNTLPKSKYDAFCKVNQICKEMGLNVLEILRDKNVECLLNDPKVLSNDAIVFIGSLKLNTEKMSPVVHLAKSKKKLSEHLVSMQEKLLDHEPT